MSKTAERTNPELWETVKDEVKQGSKGGEAGEWSARKARLAVQEYKKRGGGYRGKPSSENARKQWNEGDWGSKSGRNSGEAGEHYLGQEARDGVSEEEYRATTENKREDSDMGKPSSKQSRDIDSTTRFRQPIVAQKMKERTKADMLREAKQLEIEGRSRMDKDELAQAIRYAKH